MTENEVDTNDPIEAAIIECDKYIDSQQAAARRVLFMLVQIGVVAFAILAAFVWMIFNSQRYTGLELARELEYAIEKSTQKLAEDGKSVPPITVTAPKTEQSNANSIIVFAVISVFTVIFGVVMAVYRFHLNEISKTEHYKIGFMRIRIAAESGRKGYQSEVRDALTQLAFTVPGRTGALGKKQIDSPVPGHPVSDVGTTLLNRILDSVEIKISDKGGDSSGKAG